MKLLFKQRFFSWFDSYDIYDEAGKRRVHGGGQARLGACACMFWTAGGRHVGTVREQVLTLFEPKFEIFTACEDEYIGCITKRLAFFKQQSSILTSTAGRSRVISGAGTIRSKCRATGETVAVDNKGAVSTGPIPIPSTLRDPENALCALMLVLAIDAEKCSSNNDKAAPLKAEEERLQYAIKAAIPLQ